MDIFAGDEMDAPYVVPGGPEHVRVVSGADLDEEFLDCGEDSLSDAELLGVAAEDAADAVNRGVLGCGNSTLDELELRRVQRRAERRRVASVLRGAAEGVSA